MKRLKVETWHPHRLSGRWYPTRHAPTDTGGYEHIHRSLDLPAEALHAFNSVHEAGHCVAHLLLGNRLELVESRTSLVAYTKAYISRDSDTAFMVSFATGERASDRWLRERGLWTERRGWLNEIAAQQDRAAVAAALMDVGFGDRPRDYIEAHEAADKLLDARWGKVMYLAGHLTQVQSMTGDEVANLLSMANPPRPPSVKAQVQTAGTR